MSNTPPDNFLTAAAYQQLSVVPPQASILYGPEEAQFIDLYFPAGSGLHPVIVLLHGGCWRLEYGAKPLGVLCQALVEQGWAVCNVDYRRAGNGGDWPNTFQDVSAAVDLLPQLAADYPLDLGQVITMGHSAGGLLALWLAARSNLPENSELYRVNPQPVQAVIALAGIANLHHGVAQEMCLDGLAVVMGGLPADVPERYQQGSPHELLPLGIPHYHIVGDSDPKILANTQTFISAAQQAGDQPGLFIAPQCGHFEVVIPQTPAWTIICDLLQKLR